jgi:hypothetical protein
MLSILLLTFAVAALQGAAASTPPASVTAEQARGAGGYSYDAAGRRDPFLSLVGRGNDPTEGGAPTAGVPGLLVDEVLVKGVIRGRSGYIAMLQASDTKTYIVRAGDRLFDATVKTISQEGVVFSQEVDDPLSLVKQRHISKQVRGADVRGTTLGHPKDPK